MDASTYNEQLDGFLAEQGEVSQELFFKLAEAHHHDAASTVGRLEAKLRVLRARFARGSPLGLYDPRTKSLCPVLSGAEFSVWVAQDFPGVEVWRHAMYAS